MQVNIYIECDNSLRKTEKNYGYVLQCITSKGKQTREGHGKISGTHNKVTLHAMLEALDRMTKPSEIRIYTSNTFIANMFDHYLPGWAQKKFKKTLTEPIANAKEWQKLWEETKKHKITIIPGKHQFSEQILSKENNRP